MSNSISNPYRPRNEYTRIGLCIERLKSFASTGNFCNTNSIETVHSYNFAASQSAIIYDQLNRLINSRVQLNNGADTEFDNFLQDHLRLSETNRNGKLDIH